MLSQTTLPAKLTARMTTQAQHFCFCHGTQSHRPRDNVLSQYCLIGEKKKTPQKAAYSALWLQPANDAETDELLDASGR